MSDIHQSIIAVMREVGAIGKDERNDSQKFNYRSIDQVYNRVQPLFAKHGVFSFPKVIEQTRETGKTKQGGALHYSVLTVEYTFASQDGSSIAVTVVGEGMDSGDKASNKAMSAAHKYAICQVLNIPYDVVDPDKHTPEWAEKLDGRVTHIQLNELKKSWVGKVASGFPRDTMKEAFAEWVEKTLGGDFALGGCLDVNDFRQWSADDLERCERALEAVYVSDTPTPPIESPEVDLTDEAEAAPAPAVTELSPEEFEAHQKAKARGEQSNQTPEAEAAPTTAEESAEELEYIMEATEMLAGVESHEELRVLGEILKTKSKAIQDAMRAAYVSRKAELPSQEALK